MPFAQGHAHAISAPLLDHVVVLLDGVTFQEIFACDMLREQFARVKPKNVTSSVAGQYSALGVAGENTLLELFDGALPGSHRLTGGLVFSFEHPGSVQRAREVLDAGPGGRYELVHRSSADTGEARPWYHMLRVDLGEDSPLLMFLNEVTGEYFDSVSARRGPDGELLRSGYLDAAFGAGTHDRRWLRDITAVTLRARPQRAARMADALTAMGYRLTPAPSGLTGDAASDAGPTYRITGPGVDITLVGSATAPEGVLDITTDLHEAPQRHQEFVFGRTSRLVLRQDGTAHWTFTPPAGG